MLFRDEYRSNLRHKSAIDKIILSAQNMDNNIKTQLKLNYNSLKNVKPCNLKIADEMHMRNYIKNQPNMNLLFTKKNQISDILAKVKIVIDKDPDSSFYLKRHPNYVAGLAGSVRNGKSCTRSKS